jgi:AcrR family transcriptional regulator
MDRIARQSNVNKRMIFYYFKSKSSLFSEVLRSAWEEVEGGYPIEPEVLMPFWASFYMKNREWSRLMAWEGLERGSKKMLREKERRKLWRKSVAKMEEWRRHRKLPQSITSSHLLLSIIAIEMIPIILPNLTKLILGKDPLAPQFADEWIGFCAAYGQMLEGKSMRD